MKCNNPLVAAAAAAAFSRVRYLPTLIIGAGQNGDVIPEDANWRQFTSAAAGGTPQAPCWEVILRDAGHLQFLDKQLGLFAMFSQPGPVPDELVRRVTQVSRVTKEQGGQGLRPCCQGYGAVMIDMFRG